MQQNILKLEYKKERFDLSLMKSFVSEIISITNDGTIICQEFLPFTNDLSSVQEGKCSLNVFRNLCKRVLECIETADRKVMFIDDSSAELKIYYECEDTQTVDRGLGNDNTCIDFIMGSFFEKHFK